MFTLKVWCHSCCRMSADGDNEKCVLACEDLMWSAKDIFFVSCSMFHHIEVFFVPCPKGANSLQLVQLTAMQIPRRDEALHLR